MSHNIVKSSQIREKLLKTWRLYRRDFPWRHTHDPYRIMVAEFMLQRTRAEQVSPVYKAFIKRYPNIYKLARARRNTISKFVNHLGLHARTQNFIDAAKYVLTHYGGEFPRDRKKLLEIPGVGDYVAGAILTVCFNEPEYVVDSNIARFINRSYGLGLKGEIRRKKVIIEKAKDLFCYHDTRNLLFAMLDFIASQCGPLKSNCQSCNIKEICNLKSPQ